MRFNSRFYSPFKMDVYISCRGGMFIMKKTITTIIAMIVIVVMLLPTKLGPVIDKYNPFYKTKEYYTVVNTIGQHIGDEWYEYEFIAFDERGREQKIKKTVKHMLKRDEALKVLRKDVTVNRLKRLRLQIFL